MAHQLSSSLNLGVKDSILYNFPPFLIIEFYWLELINYFSINLDHFISLLEKCIIVDPYWLIYDCALSPMLLENPFRNVSIFISLTECKELIFLGIARVLKYLWHLSIGECGLLT